MLKTRPFWLAVLLLWCVAIYNFTQQPVFNDEYSWRLFSLLNLSYETTDTVDFIARKLAHAMIFSLLAYLVLMVLADWHWRYPVAWVFTTFCGLADEWHQLLVPGRTALLSDVFIDSTAALILITIIYVWDKRAEYDI